MSSDSIEIAKLIPPSILKLLGTPPLLSTEDVKAYYELLAHLTKDINPPDMIARMLLKDIADYFVEVLRLRQVKATIVQQATDARLKKLEEEVSRSAEEVAIHTVAAAAAARIKEAAENPAAKPEDRNKRVLELKARRDADVAAIKKYYEGRRAELARLKAIGYDICASTVGDWIHPVDKLDRLLEIAGERLARARRELERHVSGLGRSLLESAEDVIEAEVLETH